MPLPEPQAAPDAVAPLVEAALRELVDELRLIGCHANSDARCTCVIGQEAADTITALSERNRALEEALALFANIADLFDSEVEADVKDKHSYVMREIARAYEYVTKDAPPATQVTATDLERIAADFEKDSNLDRYICCNGRDCGCQGATAGAYAAYKIRALAGDGRRRQMEALIVGGPNRGQVVDIEVTPASVLELVEVCDRVRGESFWFKVEADVQDKHEYVMRELCRAYEYLMKGETHRQHIKKNGKL